MTDYVLMDPTGNLTVLVTSPVPAAERSAAAERLMAAEPEAEQLGFLVPGDGDCDLGLEMAGGEFCGNAAMSAAAWYCMERGCREGSVRLRVSGADAPLRVEVRPGEGESLRGTVEFPRPLRVETAELPLGGTACRLTVVELPGITHVIVPFPVERAAAETAVRDWCRCRQAEALGLMLLDEAAERLTPLVYVPGADTLFWERSCASGTAAAGVFLAQQRGAPVALELQEPAGILGVSAAPGQGPQLRGTVRLAHCGQIP